MLLVRVRFEGIKPVVSFKKFTPGVDCPTTKRAARRALNNLQKIDPEGQHSDVRPFFEAVISGKLPQYYYKDLKEKRAWSDDIPFHEDSYTRLKLGWGHPGYPHLKCRGNCIVSISLSLQATIEEAMVKDKSVIEAVKKYVNYPWNAFKGKKGEFWTTPDEIAFINKTLDIVMGYLEREYNLEPEKEFIPFKAGQSPPHTKDEAQNMLGRLPEKDELRPFYDAVISGTLPNYHLARLKMFKSFSDELPAKKVDSTNPANHNMKCRVNPQAGIRNEFYTAIQEGVVQDENVINAINIYWKWLFHRDNKFTTPAEIALINKTLDIVIDYLKTTYKLD